MASTAVQDDPYLDGHVDNALLEAEEARPENSKKSYKVALKSWRVCLIFKFFVKVLV